MPIRARSPVPHRRPRAAFNAAALVLILTGLVAVVASSGTPLWPPLREGPADRLVILVSVVILCGVGLLAAVAVTALAHRAILSRRPGAPPLRTTLLRALPITTAALAVLSLLVIARTDVGRGPVGGDDPLGSVIESSGRSAGLLGIDGWGFPGRAGDGVPDREIPEDGAPEPADRFPYFLMAIAAMAAAVGAVVWRRSRTGSAPQERPLDPGTGPDPDREAVRGAVMGTIDGMLADPDPNTAIIGAYARLLENLAACGAARREAEAPVEHLHRVLTTRRVPPEPLRRLVHLFEVARFSTHALTAAHRERALDALRAVAADLVEPDPGPGAGAARGSDGSVSPIGARA